MKVRLFSALLVIAGLAAVASAEVPRTVTYQGILRNADGTLVLDGNYQLRFAIYDVPSAGTALWNETQTVGVVNGVVNAILGSVTPLPLPFDRPYWLGLAIGSNPEFTPRVPLTAVPYARRAAIADSVAGGVAEDGDWIIAGEDMYAGVSGSVGIGTATPHASALLEVAGDRGFLPPRMSQAARDAISNPPTGLMVFNTDTACINYFAGGLWLALCGACVPDCAGKECGSDGCGGSCGSCPTGTHCENGRCVCDLDECTAAQSYCAGGIYHHCVEDPSGCGHWVNEDCNDGNPCTIDSCDPVQGCTHTLEPNGTPCGMGMICVYGGCVSCVNNGGSSCAGAYYFGQMCGDQGSAVLNQNGCGGGWFRMLLTECIGGLTINDLKMRVELQSPSGNNYDLFVYAPCGALWGQSTLGPGQMDVVTVTVPDQLFGNDDTNFFIEVRAQSVTSNSQWFLAARGNP